MFCTLFLWVNFYRKSVIGAELQALGARIRMKWASVGAICSMVTGVCMIAGFTEWPMKISGEGMNEWRTTLFSWLFSSTIDHPGRTSITRSPERLRWYPLRILWISGVHEPNRSLLAEYASFTPLNCIRNSADFSCTSVRLSCFCSSNLWFR